MRTADKLYEVLTGLLLQLPSLLAIVACLVAAIIRWKRHPKPSLLIVLSLLMLFAITILFAFVYAFVPDWFRATNDIKTTQTIVMIISFAYNSLWAVALAILLAAIFIKRNNHGLNATS